MNSLEVTSRQQRLDALFTKIASLNFDPEMESHWTRYLCILVSGFIEISVRIVYGEYAKRKASATSGYVMRQLNGFQNARMQKIYELAGAFNDDWRRELEKDTEGRLKEAVDSIVTNRHNIAHGRDVNLTFVDLRTYYKDAIKVLEMIDEKCNR